MSESDSHFSKDLRCYLNSNRKTEGAKEHKRSYDSERCDYRSTGLDREDRENRLSEEDRYRSDTRVDRRSLEESRLHRRRDRDDLPSRSTGHRDAGPDPVRHHEDREHEKRRNCERSRSPRRSPNSTEKSRRTNVLHSHGQSYINADPNLKPLNDDPRIDSKGIKHVRTKGSGQNTESFDPKSTLVRPDMRIVIGPKREVLGKTIMHDDVIVVPEFFCGEDDWSLYYKLVEEMRECQAKKVQGSEWIPWAEGAHLISQNPNQSKTFQMVQVSVGTRFNWYRDSTDWKPFHHDSAAFNPKRAKNQNITVGVSFGATRELAFLHAHHGTKVYFPQTNGMLFSFGRDVNILWKHGINGLTPEAQEQQDGKGRISIVLWGLVPDVKEESGSPPMLPFNGHGAGAGAGGAGGGNKASGGGGGGGRGGGGGGGDGGARGGRKEACRDFLKGHCRYGDQCRFSHE